MRAADPRASTFATNAPPVSREKGHPYARVHRDRRTVVVGHAGQAELIDDVEAVAVITEVGSKAR